MATSVELDVLSELLATAGAAFPQALSVGNYVSQMPADKVYAIREKFCRKVGISTDRQDSRLMTHYSLFIACVKKVSSDAKFQTHSQRLRLPVHGVCTHTGC